MLRNLFPGASALISEFFILPVIDLIGALRSFCARIFAHRFAYWFLALHVAALLVLVVGALIPTAGHVAPKALSILPVLYLPFLIGQIVWLSVTKNWGHFAGWFVTRYAMFKDRLSSVTRNRHIAAKRVGTSHSEGFFLTMEPASMSSGMKARRIAHHDDRHVTLIAGSRAGKGRDVILPNLSHHRGSVIAYDPSGELVRETADYREHVLGQRIIVLDPFQITDRKTDYWNPMSEIDFDLDPFAVDKCHLLAESLHHDKAPDPFWMHAPRKMLASVIGYVGARSIEENCNLSMVRDLLMTSDPSALWIAMSQSGEGEDAGAHVLGGLLKRFGEANAHRHEEELNSTMEIARTAMRWLDSPVMQDFVSRSTFSMKDLKREAVTIYIVMPAAMGQSYAAWLRVLFNAAFDVMQETSIAKPERDVLFVMDEFPLLGHMERIKRAAGEAAKFGVKLFICAQDITQLKEHYGEAWETFIANSGLLIMFSNNDLATQHYLSHRLGKEYYTKSSVSKGGAGAMRSSSRSESQELRDVARADQVEWQASRQSGKAFFFIPGQKPLHLTRASYDQWNMLDIPASKRPKPEPTLDALSEHLKPYEFDEAPIDEGSSETIAAE